MFERVVRFVALFALCVVTSIILGLMVGASIRVWEWAYESLG